MAPRWTGEKNNKNVRLPDDLHSAVKAKAAVRGFTVEDAYEEGMTQWECGGVPCPYCQREPRGWLGWLLIGPAVAVFGVVIYAAWRLT